MAEPDDPESLPTQTWSGPPDAAAEPTPVGIPPDASPRQGRWQPPEPEQLQASFPLYEIRGILGRGGMGAVYQGWQKSLHRLVAIKILPPGLEDHGANFAERFQREAQAMARFSHPGIVAVFDAGETPEGLLYFVMEYIEGTDVQRMIKTSGPLPPEHALAITAHVCDALAYAHKRGVIHRDIKPANIMVDAEGQVKVADFGLARVATDDSAALVTGSHVSMGTADFMAPEALYGMGAVDHRADLYAVGVMLYQMLTGEVPRGRFDLPSVARPGLDERFDAIVDRAMQKDPEKRYASATEIRTDLDRIVAQPPPHVSAVGPPPALEPTLPASGNVSDAEVWGGWSGDDHPRNSPAASLHPAPAITTVASPAAPTPPGRGSRVWLISGLSATIVCAIAAGAFFAKPKLSTGGTRSGASQTSASAAQGEQGRAGARPSEITLATATNDAPFVNTLGMKFVPVPITGGPTDGHRVLFSVWETRVQDYEAFVKATKREWPKPGFPQDPTHPAVNVTWHEAQAFCEWLTERAQRSGKFGPKERYRLPTDHEWSCAVEIGEREDAARSPESKSLKIPDLFPWGPAWAPPPRTGNFSGVEAAGQQIWPGQVIMSDYRDEFPQTAPVGGYAGNRFGLRDLGGNIWEWCEDLLQPASTAHVLRGGSFSIGTRGYLLSSYRNSHAPEGRMSDCGFRVVVAGAPTAPPIATQTGATRSSSEASAGNSDRPEDHSTSTPIDLLALVDIRRAAIKGTWSLKPEGLVLDKPDAHAVLELPYEPPEEYDFEVEFTPTSGGLNPNLYLRAQGQSLTWKLNAHGVTPPLYGFEMLDGKFIKDLREAAAQNSLQLEVDRRYATRVEVRRTGLRGLVDGHEFVRWSGDFQRFSMEETCKLRNERALGVGSYRRAVVFHRIQVREVTGTGKRTDSAAPASAIAPAAAIKAAP